MTLENKLKFMVNRPSSYIKAKQIKQSGMRQTLSVSDAWYLADNLDVMSEFAEHSCLRNGIMMLSNMTVYSSSHDSFTDGKIDLTGMCDITSCKCDKSFDITNSSLAQRAQHCFKQLSSGRCSDAYVHNTVGATLFPQHYKANLSPELKETLTKTKLQELFGAEYSMVRYYDYDRGCYGDGHAISAGYGKFNTDAFRILKIKFGADARLKNYDLVAVVVKTIARQNVGQDIGRIITNPTSVPNKSGHMATNAFASTVICRDKRTGKIVPVPTQWIISGESTCSTENDASVSSAYYGLPGVADAIEQDMWINDYTIYERLVSSVLQRTK